MRQDEKKESMTYSPSLSLVKMATSHAEELYSIFDVLGLMVGQRGEKNRSVFIRIQMELENAFEDLVRED